MIPLYRFDYALWLAHTVWVFTSNNIVYLIRCVD
jgi:hypothetical protein